MLVPLIADANIRLSRVATNVHGHGLKRTPPISRSGVHSYPRYLCSLCWLIFRPYGSDKMIAAPRGNPNEPHHQHPPVKCGGWCPKFASEIHDTENEEYLFERRHVSASPSFARCLNHRLTATVLRLIASAFSHGSMRLRQILCASAVE